MKSDVPKVLHHVCGVPILGYVADIAKAVGSLKTYIVLGHKADEVKDFLGTKGYTYLRQRKLLGTADAVRSAENQLRSFRGDVLILCGDTPLLNKDVIKTLVKTHKKSGALATFLTTVVHNPSGYGRVIRDAIGNVTAIREDKDAAGLERNIAEINVGVYCFKAKELYQGLKKIKKNAKKGEFYLTDIVELYTSRGDLVETVETNNPQEGLGVNTREDLAVAENVIRRKILREYMLKGVTIIDPATTYINRNVKIGEDSVIHPCTVIDENVKIGKGCTIGPFAHIRSGSKIDDKVVLGNFTEVSRTRIGAQSIMKHFSFLGDTTTGKQVNIGAGTITANFDGVNKHPTKIGDKAFIGSDSILVAPARIGKNATVGAGSIVTKGKAVPDGALAVGAPARILKRKRSKSA